MGNQNLYSIQFWQITLKTLTQMKNSKSNYSIAALIIIIMIAVGCERKFDGLELATYPTSAEVFIDGFSSGLYYAAYGTSKVTAFNVDNSVKYLGTASMRFEVPDAGDPNGSYAGGVFGTNPGRDLSGYNVLTFWAKASQPATIVEAGFGNDMGESKYKVSITNLALNSNWMKFYIPFPDPSVLTKERGMFFYSAAPQAGKGYTFWIDELKFEKLGTIAHQVLKIVNGKDSVFSGPVGNYTLSDFSATFNLPTGIDQKETIASSYYTFASSDTSKVTVSSNGTITLKNSGGVITAKVGEIAAKGSLTMNVTGPSTAAPNPSVPGANVISIYSNSYTNVKVDSYDPYWAPWMTTNYSTFKINGNDVIRYTNFNDTYNEKKVYVAITFETTPIDVTTMTYLHLDVWVPATSPNLTNKFTIKLNDFGAGGVYGGGDDVLGTYNHSVSLATNQWIGIEIPMSGFTGLTTKAHLAQMILDNFPTDIYVDNIYFHK
jgi:hypothetical protein